MTTKRKAWCELFSAVQHKKTRYSQADLVTLRTPNEKEMREHMEPYFNEIKLADIVHDYLGNPFISTWSVGTDYVSLDNLQLQNTHAMHITLPLDPDGTYDSVVDWGDGSSAHILSHDQAEVKHSYTRKGDNVVHMTGTVHGFTFGGHVDANGRIKSHPCCEQLIDISQWGCVRLGNDGSQFFGCRNFNATAIDVLDLTLVTNMSWMFSCASSFNGDVSQWDTGSVTNMENMFRYASSFNGDVSQWNTGSVTNMYGMFSRASSFNGDVSKWNTGNVTDMRWMFSGASSFNGDVSQWNTSNVTLMNWMFANALSFNGDISSWDMSKVIARASSAKAIEESMFARDS